MYYYVIGSDSKRYGPADIDTLVKWVAEGRLIAETALVERGTDRSLRAEEIDAVAAAIRRAKGVVPGPQESRSFEAPTMTSPGVSVQPQNPAQFNGPMMQVPAVPSHVGGHFPPTMPYARQPQLSSKSKLVAGLLGIFLGTLGVHRFYLGYTGIGILQLILGICTFGISGIWGFIEGIVCLCGGMRDSDGYELRD